MKNFKSQSDEQLKATYTELVNSKELFNPKTGNLKRAAIPMELVREINKRNLTIN